MKSCEVSPTSFLFVLTPAFVFKQQASSSNSGGSGKDRVDLFVVGGEDGLTPLHDAIHHKHFSIVSMYLDAIIANDRKTGDNGLIRMVKMKTGEGKTVWGYTQDSADMSALIQVWPQSPLVSVSVFYTSGGGP